MKLKDKSDEKVIRTACAVQLCGYACGMLAHVKDGVLTKLEPADYPEPKYRYACARGLAMPKVVYHPDRLKYPLKRVGRRGEGKWERISWNEALDTIASKLKDFQTRYGSKSVVLLTQGGLSLPNGGIFSGQRFNTAIKGTYVSGMGTTNAGQGCADSPVFGDRRTSIFQMEQMDRDDIGMRVFWGTNPAVTREQKYRRCRQEQENGTKVVVVNPIFTPTAAKADDWISIRPGTDAALALGMINIIEKEGLCDEPFILEYTVGPFLVRDDNGLFLRDSNGKYMVWDTKTNKPHAYDPKTQTYDTPQAAPALRGSYTVEGIECKTAFQLLIDLAAQYPVEKASEITEVAPDAIRRFALDYVNLKPVASDRGYGLQRGIHGDMSWRAISALAAVTGNINPKIPTADVFTTLNWGPFLYPGAGGAENANMGQTESDIKAFQASVMPLVQFFDQAMTDKPYPFKALYISTHNPASSHGDRNKVIEAMLRMEFIVVVDLFMTPTAELADIVLPGLTSFEAPNMYPPYGELYGGGHPYLELQPKLIEPLYECKSDIQIYTELAKRMGLEKYFDKTEEEYIELLLASGHPAMKGITLEKMRQGPVLPGPNPSALFPTPSRRIEFYVERLKKVGTELPFYVEPWESSRQPIAKKYPLYFLQTHTQYRFHSELTNVDWMLEVDPEPTLDMNPVDAEKRGIKDGDMVVAFNDRGRFKIKARFNEGMRLGAVSTAEGWWPKYYAEGGMNSVTDLRLNKSQKAAFETQAQLQGVMVEVKKA